MSMDSFDYKPSLNPDFVRAVLQKRREAEASKPKKPVGNRYGTRWRGKLPIPAKVHPLMRQLFTTMNEQNVTITEVAEKAGYQRCTISDWRYLNKTPSVVTFQNVLNAMGLDLKIVPLRKSK